MYKKSENYKYTIICLLAVQYAVIWTMKINNYQGKVKNVYYFKQDMWLSYKIVSTVSIFHRI